MKRKISILLLLIMLVSTLSVGYANDLMIVIEEGEGTLDPEVQQKLNEEKEAREQATKVFNDLNNHWGQVNIMKLYNQGGISGYPDGTVKPDGTVTRAEFLALSAKSIVPNRVRKSQSGEHWANPFFEWAVANNVIKQTEVKKDTWNNNITRYEMAKIMVKFLENVVREKPNDTEGVAKIMEDYKIVSSDKNAYYVEQAFVKGIITGRNANGLFAGNDSGTRAEAATLIIRLLNKNDRKEVVLKETEVATNDEPKEHDLETWDEFEDWNPFEDDPIVKNDYGQDFKLTSTFVKGFLEGALEETNNQRQQVGVAILSIDDLAIDIAQYKSDDMLKLLESGEEHAVYFAHDSPTYGKLRNLANMFNYSQEKSLGENLSWVHYNNANENGKATGVRAIIQLSNSPGHYQNMIKSDWEKVGFGVSYHYYEDVKAGYFFVTQTFLK